MPTYEYRCPGGHEFELFQPMSAEPRADCPECGKTAERLLSGGAGLIFKGEGFYITDYRNEAYRKAASADKEASGSRADSGGASSGGSDSSDGAGSGSGSKSGSESGGGGGSGGGSDGGTSESKGASSDASGGSKSLDAGKSSRSDD